MKIDHIKALLNAMCEYTTTKINQVFTIQTFELTNSQTQEVIQTDLVKETAQYIVAFIASHNLFINS
ncbi:hypothetical protein [Planomicrobium sp. CPCC 101079]|uniref:hypothetical protein n=1 Tax=Planomicrobium sp. CPCC 101079 TaxID=2599618 RepID=UPI0011B361D3|nr:hypothetical protein [Planomicrobium sp. CPCC 101079]TWT00119.1 hypothetical protein FQV28_18535 [Planomicrobium sp. CPCC 101079]